MWPLIDARSTFHAVKSSGILPAAWAMSVWNSAPVCLAIAASVGISCTTPISFPFPVDFYGQSCTSANASSNGNLQFASANTEFTNDCLPVPGFGPTIFAHWDDLRTDAPGEGIFTSVSGAAPFRIFDIEWRAHYFSGAGSVVFTIRFLEGLNAAEVYQFDVDARTEDRDRREWERERERQRFAIVRDFSLDNSFKWAPMEEGRYEIKVKVKDGFDATQTSSTVASYDVSSRLTGDDAVVTPTLNPLVALYSAPPCHRGEMRVRFRPAGGLPDAPWTSRTIPRSRPTAARSTR